MTRTNRGDRARKLAALLLAACLAAPGPALAGATTDAFALYARGDYKAAAARLMPLALAGDAKAQGMVGYLYENGYGVPQDFVIAAAWYASGAEQGDPMSQYLLGLLYDKGRGVAIDVVAAQKWLILAAARAGRRERPLFLAIRDAVASKMSKAQLAVAQQQAAEWVPAPRQPVQ